MMNLYLFFSFNKTKTYQVRPSNSAANERLRIDVPKLNLYLKAIIHKYIFEIY